MSLVLTVHLLTLYLVLCFLIQTKKMVFAEQKRQVSFASNYVAFLGA
jgi:hypothetical protein